MLNWLNWLNSLAGALGLPGTRPKAIPEALWQSTLQHYPFLARLPPAERQALRLTVGRFLQNKEFSGAHDLEVTDEMAVAIAAQACLPVLHLGLGWYDDFTGIVVHPGAMLARRKAIDHAGVVHDYREALLGEAMQGGPVTLSWQDVAASGSSAEHGHNVVIHEFIHKIDMRDGAADGCPPLPSRAAHAAWHDTMQAAYDRFCEQVAMAERFGGEPPWLDAYGASAPAEFFAVACEAYFVNRERFIHDFADVSCLFDQFFKQK
ncbi:zinc-dependent peptidase [Polaromonas sp. CG_9.11]|uniref:M90 family metallopeptidase n=1 Tax=Polaromonas sp. CG_9.11 TaxID=2787730 RepID=UPI001A325F41|nr:Mlc titration factor MtfA (ptsG expression regulator) [Polaromonas sp. CG_9.11]